MEWAITGSPFFVLLCKFFRKLPLFAWTFPSFSQHQHHGAEDLQDTRKLCNVWNSRLADSIADDTPCIPLCADNMANTQTNGKRKAPPDEDKSGKKHRKEDGNDDDEDDETAAPLNTPRKTRSETKKVEKANRRESEDEEDEQHVSTTSKLAPTPTPLPKPKPKPKPIPKTRDDWGYFPAPQAEVRKYSLP